MNKPQTVYEHSHSDRLYTGTLNLPTHLHSFLLFSVGKLLLLLLLLGLLFNLLKNTDHAYNNNELSIRKSSLYNSL